MLWKHVICKYDPDMAEKMLKSKYLQGITVVLVKPDGSPATIEDYNSGNYEVDTPERDVENAYFDVIGKKVPTECWD